MKPFKTDLIFVQSHRVKEKIFKEWSDKLDSATDQVVFVLVPHFQKIQEGGQIGAICSQKNDYRSSLKFFSWEMPNWYHENGKCAIH